MKNLVYAIIFTVISLISFNGNCAAGEPSNRTPNTNVGSFLCSDCEMTLGPIGPNTTVWIETVVNTFDGSSWLTSAGDPKHFFNCTSTICTRIEYVFSGTWVVTNVFTNPGNEKYKAIGSAIGGVVPVPAGNGSAGGGSVSGGGTSVSGGYWISPTHNYCYEYFSNGVSTGTFCYSTP